MNFKRLVLILFLAICLIGAVNASKDVDEFIVPSDYYPLTDIYPNAAEGVYSQNDNNSGLVIMKYGEDDEDIDMYLNSDISYSENDDNTLDFYDPNGTYSRGVYEVFEVDGEKFFADFWFALSYDVSDAEIDDIVSTFNEENDVELVSFSLNSPSSSSEKHWYGQCTTHGWVQLDEDQHCPYCLKEGRDPRVLKDSKVYE